MSQSPEKFTIVPVRLENCGRGDHRLTTFNQYDLFPDATLEGRLDGLALQLGGGPLADMRVRDERSEDERFLLRLLTRAEASTYANEPEKALRLVQEILQFKPNMAAAHHMHACILERSNRPNDALEAYNRAINSDSVYAAAYNNRGFLEMSQGDFAVAVQDYNRAIELNPTEPIAFLNRAIVRVAMGEVNGALEDMHRAIDLDPKRALFFKTRGEIIHHFAQNPRGAIADFDKAIALSPDYRDAFFKRAVAFEDSGELEAAIADYSKALSLEETSVAFSNRGSVYHRLGKNELAISDLEAALRIDPDDDIARQNLMNIQGMVGLGSFLAQHPDLSAKLTRDTKKRMGMEEREDVG